MTQAASSSITPGNPFFEEWTTPDGVPPFDRIKPEHFRPAYTRALAEHEAVRSCAVIGLPDEERGNRVHAIVEAEAGQTSADELLAFTAERLASYKQPRTIEFVDTALRDDAGKVRRSALRSERLPPA